MKNLSEKALLVNLKISQWTGRKYDKKVSRQIEKHHNAHNAGKFNKILIAEDELKKIQTVANNARCFLRENTLPWGDNGDRLLPATNYLEFVTAYRGLKDEFHDAVNKFIIQYPNLKDEARIRLNGMFQEADYPQIAEMRTKFCIDISTMPISNIKDFRLEGIGADEEERLKEKIESEIYSRITQSTKDIWIRISEAVGHMVGRLSIKDAIFHDSLVENIRELIDVLPRLNFTNNRDVTMIVENMKSLLVNPDLLRNNNNVRNSKAKEAQDILNKVEDFLK